MKKYPYNIERAVNGLSMKNPGWSIDVLLIADLVMEYIGKNNVSVDQVELSLVNGCLGINGILVERVALSPLHLFQVTELHAPQESHLSQGIH